MIHIPLWLEVPVFIACVGTGIWQERKELVRLWRELKTGERIESER